MSYLWICDSRHIVGSQLKYLLCDSIVCGVGMRPLHQPGVDSEPGSAAPCGQLPDVSKPQIPHPYRGDSKCAHSWKVILRIRWSDAFKAFGSIPGLQDSLNASWYGYAPGPMLNVLHILSHLILTAPWNCDIISFSKFKLGRLSAFPNGTLLLCNGAIIETPGLSCARDHYAYCLQLYSSPSSHSFPPPQCLSAVRRSTAYIRKLFKINVFEWPLWDASLCICLSVCLSEYLPIYLMKSKGKMAGHNSNGTFNDIWTRENWFEI